MKKVIVRGPVLTQSGYGVHARQIAKWLLEKDNIDVRFIPTNWGVTSWLLDKSSHNGLIGKIIDRSTQHESKADVSFQIQLPDEWDNTLAEKNIGVTAAVEADRCNPKWVEACNNMHAVVFPSVHAKSSITNTGKLNDSVGVHVIPESYHDSISAESSEFTYKFNTSFNFLLFGQITGNSPENDRKNMFYTIKWLCETFKNDKDVGVIIKTNVGRNTIADQYVTTNLIKKVISEVKNGQFPRFYLLRGNMTNEEVASLYKDKSVKALVSLTRGEGFGLPILEAAAAGLPIVATNWSGHVEFLNRGKFIAIDYKMVPVPQSRIDNRIFVNGAKWANPIEDDFKKKIKKLRNAYALPKEWAADLQSKLLDEYSHSSICKLYEKAFGEIL